MLVVSSKPLYAEMPILAIRQGLVELAYEPGNWIAEGKGFAAIMDGEVGNVTRFKEFRITSSGVTCGVYCEAILVLTERLNRKQRLLVQSRPLDARKRLPPRHK